jgi:hypothetical protein
MQHNEYGTDESETRNGKQRHALVTQLRCGRRSISERDIAASIQRKLERGFEPRQGEGTRITFRGKCDARVEAFKRERMEQGRDWRCKHRETRFGVGANSSPRVGRDRISFPFARGTATADGSKSKLVPRSATEYRTARSLVLTR